MSGIALTEDEAAVLDHMSEECAYWCRTMAGWVGLTEKEVRSVYRSLAAKGLAHYGTCWDEDEGRPHGSGYFLTPAGQSAKAALS